MEKAKRIYFDGKGPFSSINTFTTAIRMQEAMKLLHPEIPDEIDIAELSQEIQNEQLEEE